MIDTVNTTASSNISLLTKKLLAKMYRFRFRFDQAQIQLIANGVSE